MLNKLVAFFDHLLDLLGALAGTLVVFVMVVVGAHVVGRYLFHRPIAWVIEFSEYSLLYIVLLGSAWLLKSEGHVTVDILIHRLTPKSQSLLNFVTSILGIMACLILVWYGGQTTWDLFERGIMLQEVVTMPKWVIVAVIPVGSFLLLIQFLRRTGKYLKAWRLLRNTEQEL